MEKELFDLELYKEMNRNIIFLDNDYYVLYDKICKEINHDHYTSIYQLYPNFHWISYRDNYLDLSNLNKKQLERHWLLFGRYENRTFLPKKKYRIIFLIIDSDDEEIYEFCRYIYKSYMNLFSEILCLFIRYKEELNDDFFFNMNTNTLYIRGKEDYQNIYLKTNKAFEFIYRNLNFDYVIRTNLSSFWVFKNILKYLDTIENKKHNSIFGWKIKNTYEYVSGTGIIIHRDLIPIILKYTQKKYFYDDIEISQNYIENGVDIIDSRLENRNFVFIFEEDTMYKINKKIEYVNEDIVYFRVKSKTNRVSLDKYILSILLKKYYKKN